MHLRWPSVGAIAALLVSAGCADMTAPIDLPSPRGGVNNAAAAADLITDNPAVLAERLRAIGNANEVIVWLKDPEVAPRAATALREIEVDLPRSIGLPRPASGQSARTDRKPLQVSSAARARLSQALAAQGVRIVSSGTRIP